jgi:mgtE-like transporter
MPSSTPSRARFRALFGPDPADARQSLAALALGLLASLVAGLTLGSISDTLQELPGLLILVPAAIGLRGTVFGALGARLSTAIHTGSFSLNLRLETVVGQNLAAAAVLSVVASVALAVLAKVIAVGFGVVDSISVADLLAISVIGGLLSSIVVLVMTVGLAAASVRFGWDSDNVTAPLVTASGDMITLPALYLATLMIDVDEVVTAVALLSLVLALGLLLAGLRSTRSVLRSVVRESLPIVVLAGVLSLVAGLTLEGQLESLSVYPALLALVPPFLAVTGAIGGILSSRLGSKLHLGYIDPAGVPQRPALSDIRLAFVVAVPAFVLGSLVGDLASWLLDLDSPGPLDMVLVSLLGGLLATSFAVVVAYYTAIVTYRLGLDPDNFGIPMVTSSIDLLGSVSFILAVAVFVGTVS